MIVCALPGANAAVLLLSFLRDLLVRCCASCAADPSSRNFSSICCPVPDSSNNSVPPRARCELLCDLFEWLGAAASGLENVQRAPLDQYVTELRAPAQLPYRSEFFVQIEAFWADLGEYQYIMALQSSQPQHDYRMWSCAQDIFDFKKRVLGAAFSFQPRQYIAVVLLLLSR
jgi:hypothetical protein